MSLLFHRQLIHIGSVLTFLLLTSAHGLLEWVSRPENRSVVIGQDLVLSCQARLANQSDLSTAVTYVWLHNGTDLPDKASRFFNNSLFVPRVSPLDVGTYTCVVSSADENGNVYSVNSSSVVIKAYIEPFILPPLSVDAGIGEKVVLTCITGRSSPSLEVRWLRDGDIFLQGDQRTVTYGDFDVTGLSKQLSTKLTIVMTGDLYGTYQCVANNKFLNSSITSSPASVTYKITPGAGLPVIEWNHPESLVVSEGHDLVLSCRTQESTEFIQVLWYVNQNQITSSSRIYTLANGSLGFFPYLVQDDGNYSCLAVNSVGQSLSPSVWVTAAYLAQHFSTEPSDTTAVLGSEVILRCDPPESSPPALVTWYKDYSPLNLTTPDKVKVIGHDLHLPSVGLSDRGSYYCVAVNSMSLPSSRTSAPAVLKVQGPPIMTVPPMNTKIIKGKLLQLTCLVDGDPLPINSWLFQARPLLVDEKMSIVKRGQELWVSDVGKEWEGLFTCVATNSYGTASADAFVTVTAPPESLQPIGNLVVRAGNPLLIHCYVVSDPMPVVQWYFNGRPLNPNSLADSSFALVNSDLAIGKVTANHAGNYSCVGSNEAGKATSSGSVTVNVPPTITETSKTLTPVIGQSVTLFCHTQGQPPPTVYWLYNLSVTLPQNSALGDSNTFLTIVNLTWANSGQYTCMAQNLVGTAQTSTYITLTVPPKIEAKRYPLSPVKLYTSFVLSCSASGLPAPDLQWVRWNQIVQPTSNGRVQCPERGVLVVQFALKNDSGFYECWANSSAGVDKAVVSVTVYGPPSPPALVSAVPLSSESVYLTWQWQKLADEADTVDQFQVSYREKTFADFVDSPVTYMKNITRVEVIGLKSGTEYIFYVSAINDAGTSLPSNILSAVTYQSGPSAPVNLKVKYLNSTAAILTWEQPITPNGVVRLYQFILSKVNGFISDIMTINISSPTFPTQELLLSPLRPYTQYNGQVKAANIENGHQLWGSYSPMLTFQTAASKPTLPPQFVQLNAVDPYSVKVAWQQIPVLAQNGPILFYNVSYRNESLLSTTVRVDNSVTEYTINGLFPWRRYTAQVSGVNTVGEGPVSDPIGTWTLPVAPVTPPTELKATAIAATSLTLTWKAIQPKLSTCNVTSYRIQVRVLGLSVWQEKTTSYDSSSSLSYTLDNLQAWTPYECQVAAFCEMVTPGLGPYTFPVYISTLQGVSGPVNSLIFSTTSNSITVSWQPPFDVKGVLIGYKVSFNPIENANISRDGVLFVNKSVTLVTLDNLNSDVIYNISVAAMNEAGGGEEVILRVRTLAALPTEAAEPTDVSLIQTSDISNSTGITYTLRQQGGNSLRQNLAAIVAGSIVGTIALVILTIFVCLQCIKYRRKQRMNYVISTDTENADTVHSYRPLESALSTPFTPSVVVTDYSSIKSPRVTESQSAPAILNVQPSNHSSFSSSVAVGSSISSKIYNNNNNQEKPEQKMHGASKNLTIPKISVSNAYAKLEDESCSSRAQGAHGIENLGFVPAVLREERKSYSYLDVPRLSVISDDTISVTSDTLKRRNRMRSDSAAAIAVLKTSQSTISSADTDVLVENEIESEVIFNERTVL